MTTIFETFAKERFCNFPHRHGSLQYSSMAIGNPLIMEGYTCEHQLYMGDFPAHNACLITERVFLIWSPDWGWKIPGFIAGQFIK